MIAFFEGAGAVPLWATLPFALLLLMIATGPLLFHKFWHHHYPKVALGLGALVALYYLLMRNEGGHGVHKLFHAGTEYFAFVALIGSLFVVASTVLIHIRAAGTTTANAALLGFAAMLSNLVGTTGASMLLIRPYLRMNKHHYSPHYVVFFIFLVANVGGSLTPIGDPPLFLGYLKGVPFFWTAEHLAVTWFVATALLIFAFIVVDRTVAKRGARKIHRPEKFGIEIGGLKSFIYIFLILGLVFIQNEPIVKDHAPVSTLLIAAAMTGLAAGAYMTADRNILKENEFTFDPVKEVAFLFAGIFLTMIPALEFLEQNADHLGLKSPVSFYFATGVLSAFLDNAPTYLTFLTADMAVSGRSIDQVKDVTAHLADPDGALAVAGISAGAVFFGAMTYIGNGPNFMVKSITEAAGLKCPTFFGYLFRWAVPVLLPILIFIGFVFFYHA